MARITVEDSLKQIPNRFELTLIATYRARMLAQGHTPKVESRNKPTVTALREVAAGQVGREMHARPLPCAVLSLLFPASPSCPPRPAPTPIRPL